MTRPLPMKLMRWARLHPLMFDEGWTEQDSFAREGGWSHWIYLKPGWANLLGDPRGGLHVIHEANVRETMKALAFVGPCRCRDCQRSKKP